MSDKEKPAGDTPEEVSGELVESGRQITRMMRNQFDAEQVNLIRATVADELNDAELSMFLEVAARHELDPFIKEIWGIKIKGKPVIFASRDGLMGIAERHTPGGKYHTEGAGRFKGCASGTLREHDYFDIDYSERDEDETSKVEIKHKFLDEDGKSTHGGKDGQLRGQIVAGWARVRREGHDDTFFMAYWDTYNQGRNAWSTHADRMIQKCAESACLRLAFSVAGIVGEGELTQGNRAPVSRGAANAEDTMHWPEDEELKEKLTQGFRALGWRRAKVRMTLASVGMENGYKDFEALLNALMTEADRENADTPPEENIQDADVVGEGEDDDAADARAA